MTFIEEESCGSGIWALSTWGALYNVTIIKGVQIINTSDKKDYGKPKEEGNLKRFGEKVRGMSLRYLTQDQLFLVKG